MALYYYSLYQQFWYRSVFLVKDSNSFTTFENKYAQLVQWELFNLRSIESCIRTYFFSAFIPIYCNYLSLGHSLPDFEVLKGKRYHLFISVSSGAWCSAWHIAGVWKMLVEWVTEALRPRKTMGVMAANTRLPLLRRTVPLNFEFWFSKLHRNGNQLRPSPACLITHAVVG